MQKLGIQRFQFLRIETRRRAGRFRKVEQRGERLQAFLRLQRLGCADQRGMRHDRQGFQPVLAKAVYRQRAETLRQSFALRAREKIVVREGWNRRADRLEDLDLHRRVRHMVFAADNMGDAQIRMRRPRW